MKIRYLVGENLSAWVVATIQRHYPQLDVLRVGDAGAPALGTLDLDRGPVAARDAYTGAPFKFNRAYAERFASYWVMKKTSGEIPRTRGAIAWRLARAYAQERDITDEQAMQELFEEVTGNTTPALVAA
jgi:hypothetical protein